MPDHGGLRTDVAHVDHDRRLDDRRAEHDPGAADDRPGQQVGLHLRRVNAITNSLGDPVSDWLAFVGMNVVLPAGTSGKSGRCFEPFDGLDDDRAEALVVAAHVDRVVDGAGTGSIAAEPR